MKLKCIEHKQRVVVVNNGAIMHRTGHADRCSSSQVWIGSEAYTAADLQTFGLVRPPRSVR